MFRDAVQKRANAGEQEALREIYNKYSKKVYALTQAALGDADTAKSAVKQVFLRLYHELMRAESDIDIAARLSSLINDEVRIQRIARGDFSEDTLQIQYTVSAEDDSGSNDTMVRIHQRMVVTPEEERKTEPKKEPVPVSVPAPDFADSVIEEAKEESFQDNRYYYRRPERVEQIFEKPKRKGGNVIITILLILLILVFVWLLVGILMDLRFLPFLDLGYSFFNKNFFEFFRIPQGV